MNAKEVATLTKIILWVVFAIVSAVLFYRASRKRGWKVGAVIFAALALLTHPLFTLLVYKLFAIRQDRKLRAASTAATAAIRTDKSIHETA
jgi:amino acid permease